MTLQYKKISKEKMGGQVLLEIMVAGMIIIFISLAVAQGIASSLRGVQQSAEKTTGAFLSREIIEASRAIALEDWHFITDLATSSIAVPQNYYATTTGGKWNFVSSAETMVMNNISYVRAVNVYDVYRATSTGNIASSGYWDPSTTKIVTSITWTNQRGMTDSFAQTVYLSRYTNDIFPQDQWLSANGDTVVVDPYPTTFSTSSNISTSSGGFSLQIQ